MIETSIPDCVEPPARAMSPKPSPRWRQRLWWGLRVAQVRLRFLFVLLAAFLIVGKWHVLRNYWDTLTAPSASGLVSGGVSAETQYFCPMCPGVISVWPTKCSVCNMPLVRRKTGGAEQLPDGVLARMQLSPYRVHLAGIQTSEVGYRPLLREILAPGAVKAEIEPPIESRDPQSSDSDGDQSLILVVAEIDQRDIPFVSMDTPALVARETVLAGEPQTGRVSRIRPEVSPDTHRVKIEIAVADSRNELWPGMQVNVRIRRPIAELGPFCSQPTGPPPLEKGEPRTLYFCPEHPRILRDKRLRCPEDDHLLMDRPLTELERMAWWCPMHPEVTADKAGRACEECNGMQLVPRIVQYRPAGEVLAVPESAVIDLGDRRVVYLESMPGMFDALEVVVGPRCDGYYPVVRGLEPGQRVAAAGAFLLDAETRLNPSVAAGYFGASRAASGAPAVSTPSTEQNNNADAEAAEIRQALAQLTPADRRAAERQKICPVTSLPLGSMGAPIKARAGDRIVWLCCEGCQASFVKNPAKHLKTLPQAAQP